MYKSTAGWNIKVVFMVIFFYMYSSNHAYMFSKDNEAHKCIFCCQSLILNTAVMCLAILYNRRLILYQNMIWLASEMGVINSWKSWRPMAIRLDQHVTVSKGQILGAYWAPSWLAHVKTDCWISLDRCPIHQVTVYILMLTHIPVVLFGDPIFTQGFISQACRRRDIKPLLTKYDKLIINSRFIPHKVATV